MRRRGAATRAVPRRIRGYGDEGEKDHGYGCVYRNTQTLLEHLGAATVPSVRRMMREAGVPRHAKGRDRWIEPHQARALLCRYAPGARFREVAYMGRPDAFRHSRRTPRAAVKRVFTRPGAFDDAMQRALRRSNVPVLVDNGTSSYLVLGPGRPGYYLIGDPHERKGRRIRELSVASFYRSPLWLALLPRPSLVARFRKV